MFFGIGYGIGRNWVEFIENGYEFYGIEKYGVCWEIMWEWLREWRGGGILSSLFIVLGNVYGYMGVI